MFLIRSSNKRRPEGRQFVFIDDGEEADFGMRIRMVPNSARIIYTPTRSKQR